VANPRTKLQKMFEVESRHANFGDCLVSMHAQGFRCHSNTMIEIHNPITAFCGLNGTGKSTLLQLAAAAYKRPGGEPGRYYVASFLVAGTLDPTPYAAGATAEFGYWQADRTVRKLSVTRIQLSKRWSGYKSQPQRTVYFAGMGLYLPRIEIRDFAVRNARSLQVLSTEALPDGPKGWVERILGGHYDAMDRNTIKHPRLSPKIVTASRNGVHYSEANMGCGEGRVQHFIQELERLPEKSLILLEEPETSLHQSAQFELGRYLIDVCIRRKHQILMTTHAESLLSALPSASRIYLDRSTGTLRPINGLSSAQAACLMANAGNKALHILVEDSVAQAVLREIIRKSDATFLRTVEILPVGDRDAIQRTMLTLAGTQLPLAAVRDGDTNANPQQNLFSLPGSQPPEKEIIGCAKVAQCLADRYNLDLGDFMATVDQNDHHSWFGALASAASLDETSIVTECAIAYVTSLSENVCDALVGQLKAAGRG
jgi:predicted ATPase